MDPISKLALVAGLLAAPLVYAQGASGIAASPGAEAPVDQVVVEATRNNVAKLRKDVLLAEIRFYELYNTLNKKRDYAIKCATEASTGTRFTRTDCQPVFKTKAEEAEAREFLRAFGAGDQVSGTPGGVTGPQHVNAPPPPPSANGGSTSGASMAIAAARPGFKQNMIDITNNSPELQKIAREHAELWKRYYSLYRQLNGAGPPPEGP